MESKIFGVIPSTVRYDERLSANAKILYAELTSIMDVKGYCFITNSELAELYNVSLTTMSKWIKNLIDCGYIETENMYSRYGKKRLITVKIF